MGLPSSLPIFFFFLLSHCTCPPHLPPPPNFFLERNFFWGFLPKMAFGIVFSLIFLFFLNGPPTSGGLSGKKEGYIFFQTIPQQKLQCFFFTVLLFQLHLPPQLLGTFFLIPLTSPEQVFFCRSLGAPPFSCHSQAFSRLHFLFVPGP